ncbi:aminodeoxychorismate synthase component I [Thiofilum flexile]|uniref:aminodeoxychorismate synthase component I n=1 Tax=Thiofilum flexile TaxID=125627 RepID=UPI0003824E4E|nr:aminodeoxychorismate synthase component I [Thiofilum flexile]
MLHYIAQGEYSLLALHQTHPKLYPFLLESVAHSANARFSLLFCYPQERLTSSILGDKTFLEQLQTAWQQEAIKQDDLSPPLLNHLPFAGGWFVYLGYELAQSIEPVLNLTADRQQLPIACAVRIPVALIVDHHSHTTHLIAEPTYLTEFNELKQQLANSLTLKSIDLQTVAMHEDAPEQFIHGVERCKDYIVAGDVFQVNLSRAWQGHTALSASTLYQQLRQANPAPFAGIADFGEFSIISSSPERLVRVSNNIVETRPIAGTRPRSNDEAEDGRLLAELINHPKERAEHVMLIDLERNDMGRICRYGSIKVDEMMVLESYQHVHHIVSNIRGELAPNITPSQVLKAVFPGGTITGCPKVRCMEIIAELEKTGRGAYTGSMGYINHNGAMDFNILIRTLTLKDQQLVFRTGAGIVMDSIPHNELQETRHKARGLLRALGHQYA